MDTTNSNKTFKTKVQIDLSKCNTKDDRITQLNVLIESQPKNEFGNVIITDKNYKLFIELTDLQKV